MSDLEHNGEFLLYQTDDGIGRIRIRMGDETVWLTQAQLGDLYQTTTANIGQHIKNILAEDELVESEAVRKFPSQANDGKSYRVNHYNLNMILAVGYRVRSPRGTQFRQWATRNLAEYLVKGFVMDDERLKNPGGWDYFDELLERIREIRASEKRFYQKVRDLFSLSSDYQDDPQAVGLFFAEVQNKLLFAVAERTAAEIVIDRADPEAPNTDKRGRRE